MAEVCVYSRKDLFGKADEEELRKTIEKKMKTIFPLREKQLLH